MSEPLPCPFCGTKKTRLIDHGKDCYLIAFADWVIGVNKKMNLSSSYPSGERMAKAWNTRYHFGLTDEDYNILLDEMGIAKPERTAHWQPTFIDGKPAATCSSCGAVEWDYDTDEPWEYCHGCGAKVVS